MSDYVRSTEWPVLREGPMKPHPYLLVVSGDVRPGDREWLGDLAITALGEGLTGLTATLDQSALHGVFRRLQFLALDLYEVHRLCACAGSPNAARVAARVS